MGQARIDQTRELACDEIAAESLSSRAQYARSLLSIAQFMDANQRPAAGYALGLSDTNTPEDRTVNVVAKGNRIRKTTARASALATLFLLLVNSPFG
jgi:beta-lactamase regulating signal transducer with metallopeptidase domain